MTALIIVGALLCCAGCLLMLGLCKTAAKADLRGRLALWKAGRTLRRIAPTELPEEDHAERN